LIVSENSMICDERLVNQLQLFSEITELVALRLLEIEQKLDELESIIDISQSTDK